MIDSVIKIAAVGDIALSHDYDRLLETKGSLFPFDKIRETFNDQDIVMGNLEAPLSLKGQSHPFKCSLRSNPQYVEGLKSTGFNIFTIANNHVLDYKESAFFDTIKNLDKHGIKYIGAGKNISKAREPVIQDVKGIKIGFLGYCDVVIDSPFYASINERGIVPLKLEYLKEDIANLKSQVDVVVISLHWGIENFWLPTPEQRALARKMIDSGANLIIGHHSHVAQGLEKWKHGLIAYSLGNFVFSKINWQWKTEEGELRKSTIPLKKINRESFILKVEVNVGKKVDCAICGTYIGRNGQLQLAPSVNKKIRYLSGLLELPDYDTFFIKELRRFQRRTKLMKALSRLTRLHKLNLKHFYELISILRKRNET